MERGPSRREIDRVREALERHDSELREDDAEPPPEASEPAEDEEDEE
jgi:hypothetical protein